ncbi:phage tail tape measure protein [Bacillus sp. Hm123]|uniref:phage tail tape measure protein n=1 Tax=Bacillus sp. Hm123 TaxID=3450745 RepID=UPI003F4384AF
MAENNGVEVGALRVSLGLESASFTQSMQDITRKIKGLNSEFNAAAAGNKEFEQTLDGMRAKSRQLTGTYQLQQQRVQQLREEYERSVREKGKDAKATENLLIRYNNALAAVNRTSRALEEVNDNIDDATNKWKQLGNSVRETGEKMKSAGEGMANVGSSMTASITAPLTAFGLGAMKVASDVEDSGARLRTQLGLTEEKAESLNKTAQNVWKQGFGESMAEVSDAVAKVYQTMGNLPEKELEKITASAFSLAKAFDADVNETTRAAGQLMQQFGIDSTKAMDMITVAFQRGGNYSDELLDSISEYSTQFANMGFSAEQMMGMFASGAESGIFSIDKLADTVKESFLQITDGADNTRSALGELGLDYKQIESDMAAGGDKANAAFGVIMTAIAGVTDEAKRNALAIELMGTPIEDLGPQYQAFFADVGEGMTGFEGAAAKASKTIQDSFGERTKKLWRETQEALVPVGEVLVGIGEDILPKVSKSLETVTNWFEKLSPEGQKIAVGFGIAAAAAGPLIAGIGFIAGGIGSLVGVIGPAVAGLGGMAGITAGLGTAFTVLTGPVGLTVAALAALGFASYKVAEELKKPALESEVFSEKVSESTQKVVGSYLKMDEEATLVLNQMAWSQQEVTSNMVDSLVSKYDEMGERILTSMQEKQNKQLEQTQQFFAHSNALSDEEEVKAVERLQKNNENHQTKIIEGQERIKAILTQAKEEKRAISETERTEIASIQDQMRVSAVQTLSKGEVEQKAILARLKTESSKITAEQAAQVVANSVKQKDETVKQANDQYKKTVANIIRMRDETGVISADQAKKLISEAEKQRDGAVSNAEDMHKKVVKEAKAQAGEHAKEVEWETGQVKSKWQVMKDDVSKKSKEIKDAVIKSAKDQYKDFTKWVGDTVDAGLKKWENFKGGLKDIWDGVIKDMKKLKKDMIGYAEKIINGPIHGLNTVMGALGIEKKIKKWVPQYAKGTEGHPGGLAVVNDGVGPHYKELIQMPSGKVGMFEGRNVLANLPRGTKVLSGDKTNKVMKSKGVPHYKDGVGAMDWLSMLGDPMGMLKKASGNFMDKLPKLGGGPLEIGVAVGKKAMSNTADYLQEQITKFFTFDIGSGFSFPAPFRRTSGFGRRFHPIDKVWKGHGGVDWAAPQGTPIPSQTGGKVIFSGVRGGYGNAVIVDGGGGMTYLYGHNSKNLVKAGDTVKKGQILGLVGSTGKSTGPHVHFEVRQNGKAIDPDTLGGGDFGNFKGSGANMARAAITQALKMLNKPMSLLKPLMTIAQKESGFNPNAVNNWDINARRGDPSVGMFQIINSTFQRWKYPGMNDRRNPLHSALAAIRYMDGRYGGVHNHPGIKSMMKGGGYKPYKNGTNFHPGGLAMVNDGNGPELIQFPSGSFGMFKGKNVLADLPRGTKVLQHEKTKEVIKAGLLNDVPRYKDGTGDLIYQVKKGDTLTAIAKKLNTTVDQLVKLNKIQNKNLIRVGQKITYGTKTIGTGQNSNSGISKPQKDDRSQVAKDIAYLSKKYKDSSEERFRQIDAYVARKKEAGKLSLYDEIQVYRESLRYYKKNSQEWFAAEQKLNQTKVQMHNELKSLKDDYLAKVKEVNKRVIDEEKRLNDGYNQALENRTNTIKSFSGLFNKVEKPEDKMDPQELIDNLHSQVYALNNWRTNLDHLASRGIDKALLEELQEMGPQALAEIKALNDMTDTQLSQFEGLWKDKTEAARLQATKELTGMKQETLKQIEQLHRDAEKELDELNKTFTQKVTELRTGAINEFEPFGAQLKDIGTNAIKGLMDGMSSMTGPLSKKMKEISDLMIQEMKKSLEIKSPARRPKKEVTKYFGLGLIGGLDEIKSPLISKMKEISNLFTEVVPVPEIPESVFATSSGYGRNNYDYFSPVEINVNLNYNGTGSEEDAMHMADIVDTELNWRAKNKMITRGIR